MKTIRIFISSVQKELELERAAIAALISTDPFLLRHCEPVLFEKEPPSSRPSSKPYLETLKNCQAYVLMVANEYGSPDESLSATHHEYRLARELKLPSLIFLKGSSDESRPPKVKALIDEAKNDGFTYKRFHDREDLRPSLREALLRMLKEEFDLHASSGEMAEGGHQVEAASKFESSILRETGLASLDSSLVERFAECLASDSPIKTPFSESRILHSRGLAVKADERNQFHPTAAAFLLFSSRPADRFPHCEILADAYEGLQITGRPKGQLTINAALPLALEEALKFIDNHTFHPRRVVGLNNVRLDEYPTHSLREALVNAVAHRDYEDTARKILLRIFSDRIEIASPGYPLKPLTPARLSKGGYRPCSRNPVIAQTLATLSLMEQRGTGFARMRAAMLDHGLSSPELAEQDGFFVVTLFGPAGNFDLIKTPTDTSGPVTPAIEAQLNERQKRIFIEVQKSSFVTSGWCRSTFGVALLTVQRDLAGLIEAGLIEPKGKGRGARYVVKTSR